jgi:hypothetical protein
MLDEEAWSLSSGSNLINQLAKICRDILVARIDFGKPGTRPY